MLRSTSLTAARDNAVKTKARMHKSGKRDSTKKSRSGAFFDRLSSSEAPTAGSHSRTSSRHRVSTLPALTLVDEGESEAPAAADANANPRQAEEKTDANDSAPVSEPNSPRPATDDAAAAAATAATPSEAPAAAYHLARQLGRTSRACCRSCARTPATSLQACRLR